MSKTSTAALLEKLIDKKQQIRSNLDDVSQLESGELSVYDMLDDVEDKELSDSEFKPGFETQAPKEFDELANLLQQSLANNQDDILGK